MKTKKTKVLATISAEDWAKIPELDEEKMKTKKIKPLRGGALARAAVNQILLHPETWDQSDWHSDCGTTHCFGGWCQILAGKQANPDTTYRDARLALGLVGDYAEYLFSYDTQLTEIYGFVSTFRMNPKDLKPFKE